jgi:uncharacterized protein (DUF427 family)
MRVEVNGEVVGQSDRVIQVNEDGHPARYYFPRQDVRMDKLDPTQTTTECPFKGIARYFTVNAAGKKFRDAAWSYENPYDEHQALKDHLAFYDDKVREIRVEAA